MHTKIYSCTHMIDVMIGGVARVLSLHGGGQNRGHTRGTGQKGKTGLCQGGQD